MRTGRVVFFALLVVSAAVSTGSATAGFGGANGRIAFASNRDGDNEIYLMNSDGSSVTKLTDNGFNDRQPAFSPGGNKLAFTSDRDGNNEIYVMNTDGSGVLRVTTNAASETEPEWTTDGGTILFTSDRDGNNEIYTVTISTSGTLGTATNRTNNAANDRGAEASSQIIAFTTDRSGNDDVYGISATTFGAAFPLNGGDLSSSADFGADPVSSGASTMAFTSARDANNEIYTWAAGAPPVQTRRTNNAADDRSPAYSPDSTKIVFVTDRDGNDEIYTINADGSSATRLTNDAGIDADPDWGPTRGAAGGSETWPTCSYGRDQRCITAFTASVSGSLPLGAPPGSIRLAPFEAAGLAQIQVVATSGADVYDVVANGGLTTNSLVHVELNLGAIDPVFAIGNGLIETFSYALDATNGNTVTLEMRPRGASYINPSCPNIECGDNTTQATVDYGGLLNAAAGTFPDSGLSGAQLAFFNSWVASMRGSFVSTDAQVLGSPTFNPGTSAFSILIAAPHLTTTSAVNTGYLTAFLPNSMLTFWGLDPAGVNASSFSVTQTKNGTTTTMTPGFAALSGGVRLSFAEGTFTYSRPQFTFDSVTPSSPSPPATVAPAAPAVFADVGVKLDGPAGVELGGSASYTATVRNDGSSEATGVAVTLAIPAGFDYVSAGASSGGCYGGGATATCTIGSLAAGASATVTLVLKAESAGGATVTALVTTTAGDPNQLNQTAALVTTVSAPAAVTPPATPPPAVVAPPVTPPAAQPPAATPPAATPPAATPPSKPKPAAKPKAKAKKKAQPKKKAAPKKKQPKKR